MVGQFVMECLLYPSYHILSRQMSPKQKKTGSRAILKPVSVHNCANYRTFMDGFLAVDAGWCGIYPYSLHFNSDEGKNKGGQFSADSPMIT